jgi:hypothetical protein
VSILSPDDRDDLARAIDLARDALALIYAVGKRHSLDLTGPALLALNRATVDLEMFPLDVRNSASYLDAGNTEQKKRAA